jgi:hypothetical protein
MDEEQGQRQTDQLVSGFNDAIDAVVDLNSRIEVLERELAMVQDMVLKGSRYEDLRRWAVQRNGGSK